MLCIPLIDHIVSCAILSTGPWRTAEDMHIAYGDLLHIMEKLSKQRRLTVLGWGIISIAAIFPIMAYDDAFFYVFCGMCAGFILIKKHVWKISCLLLAAASLLVPGITCVTGTIGIMLCLLACIVSIWERKKTTLLIALIGLCLFALLAVGYIKIIGMQPVFEFIDAALTIIAIGLFYYRAQPSVPSIGGSQ